MSKGMYCSASHWMDSASSSWDIAGTWIFLMITGVAGERGGEVWGS
jgi:hypothetical protein